MTTGEHNEMTAAALAQLEEVRSCQTCTSLRAEVEVVLGDHTIDSYVAAGKDLRPATDVLGRWQEHKDVKHPLLSAYIWSITS